MAAVVGPVGVHHPDLGDGGVSVLLIPEIILQEFQIVQVHGKTQLVQQRSKTGIVQGGEAFHGCHGGGGGILRLQSLGQLQGGLPALHSVDHILFDGCHLLVGEPTHEHIDLGGADQRAVALRDDLQALGSGVRPLVVLTGQGLHRKDHIAGGDFVRHIVHLGLGEYGIDTVVEKGLFQVFRIVAVQHPHTLQAADLQKITQLPAQGVGLMGLAGLFFHIYTIDHGLPPYLFASSARWPMSLRRYAPWKVTPSDRR